MSSTALGAEKAIIFISDAHKNSTTKNWMRSSIRTYTTKHLYIVLVSVMI